MASFTHLQNVLNKVIEEVRNESLNSFVAILIERLDVLRDSEAEIKLLLDEYKASYNSHILSFGPKKKEKKTRPPNNYNMFIKEKMREIKEAHPEYKGKELMKKATEEWNKKKAADAANAANAANAAITVDNVTSNNV
jgi:hypothetical protein